MARKTQISKDIILEAAFKMLVREGYASINIKALAKEIGCSTQPIFRVYKNMDELLDAVYAQAETFFQDYSPRTAATMASISSSSAWVQMPSSTT